MFVDWPDLKSEFAELVNQRLRATLARQAPVLSMTRRIQTHEGHKIVLLGPHGEPAGEIVPTSHEFSVEMPRSEVKTIADVDRLIAEMASKVAQDMEGSLFDVMSAAPPEVAQRFSAATPEEAAENIVRAFSAIDMSFDEEGKPSVGFMFGPQNISTFLKADTPELRARLDAITEEKRRAWITREADRRLVD